MVDLFEETERLKLRFIAAYDRLCEQGLISEADLDEIIDILDRIDEVSEEELVAKLGKYQGAVPGSLAAPGDGQDGPG